VIKIPIQLQKDLKTPNFTHCGYFSIFYMTIFLMFGKNDLMNYDLNKCITDFRAFFFINFFDRYNSNLIENFENFLKKYFKK
jgi:hypothetical protein